MGLPAAIYRLADQQCRYNLAVSLHAPDDALRNQLVPVNQKIGLADILAGDNHGDDRSVAGGADFLHAQDGHEQAELLTVRNPGAILRDEPLVEVPPLLIRRTWMQRFRHMLGGQR